MKHIIIKNFPDGAREDEIPNNLLKRSIETLDEAEKTLRVLGLDETAINNYRERINIVNKAFNSSKTVKIKNLLEDWIQRQ